MKRSWWRALVDMVRGSGWWPIHYRPASGGSWWVWRGKTYRYRPDTEAPS